MKLQIVARLRFGTLVRMVRSMNVISAIPLRRFRLYAL